MACEWQRDADWPTGGGTVFGRVGAGTAAVAAMNAPRGVCVGARPQWSRGVAGFVGARQTQQNSAKLSTFFFILSFFFYFFSKTQQNTA